MTASIQRAARAIRNPPSATVSFLNFTLFPAVRRRLEEEIFDRVRRLERFHGRILSSRVVMEGPGRHHRRGRYRVSVFLSVPGPDVVVTRQTGERPDLALREAFKAVRRRLEDVVRLRRGFVKTHAVPADGMRSRGIAP